MMNGVFKGQYKIENDDHYIKSSLDGKVFIGSKLNQNRAIHNSEVQFKVEKKGMKNFG